MEYANIVWDNCTQEQSDLLESIQLEAARIITGLRRGTSHNILYGELGWEPLETRRKKSKLLMFYKILNNEAPDYLIKIVDDYNVHEPPYNLRYNNMRFQTPRTVSFQMSYFPSTIRLWNTLDMSLKTSTSLLSLKRALNVNLKKPPHYFSIGDRKLNICLCQLRNDKSDLKYDLYNGHLFPSADCGCGSTCDDSYHYFFECPHYINQRKHLMNSLLIHHDIRTNTMVEIDLNLLLVAILDYITL